MVKKVVIPAEAGIHLFKFYGSLLSQGRRLDSRFHGNDRKSEPLRTFVSKS